MKKYIIITADTNDGDYINRKTQLKENWENTVKKVCKIIKKDKSWGKKDMQDSSNDPNRWVESKDLTQEEVDLFNDLAPSGEYGIHTIENVEIIEVVKETKLL